MTPLLTTITYVWNRPIVLWKWVEAVRAATRPGVQHLVFLVGETTIPDFVEPAPSMHFLPVAGNGTEGIGHWHMKGADMADTEWVMKLDVDALPNVCYFEALLDVIDGVRFGQWFNGGMLFTTKQVSEGLLTPGPLDMLVYDSVMRARVKSSSRSYSLPAGSNWVARRTDFQRAVSEKDLEGFRGWGWEDYYQLYCLERLRLGCNPLPGPLDLSNVTKRCRDEISRPRALELYHSHPVLCLLHHWHPVSTSPGYREHSQRNRRHLLDCIQRGRQ